MSSHTIAGKSLSETSRGDGWAAGASLSPLFTFTCALMTGPDMNTRLGQLCGSSSSAVTVSKRAYMGEGEGEGKVSRENTRLVLKPCLNGW